MNRFKFRAWDEKEERLWEVYSLVREEQSPFCLCRKIGKENEMSEAIPSKRLTFIQCTGLKDKNGKLIYEGDIVDNGFVHQVKYKDGGFSPFRTHNSDYMMNENCEIVGNIYENKELLKGKEDE